MTPTRALSTGPGRVASQSRGGVVNPVVAAPRAPQYGVMTSLAVILILIGIALLLVGIFVEAAKFLLWVGLVIVIIAVIAWLLRSMRRNT